MIHILLRVWPELGLPSKGVSYHARNQLLPNNLQKRMSKSAKYRFATKLQKDPLNNKVFGFGQYNEVKVQDNF